jgi:hypothetical protein
MPAALRARLLFWTAHVEAVFLARQHPDTGLLPASTAHNTHGDYGHAWVRDNVYSILGAWTLARAWRRWLPHAEDGPRLDAAVEALMRGLLAAMMGQADRVERFKATEEPTDALHAKYDTGSGKAVVGDDGWGHLQLDATGLFLLQLAQMSASGLSIVRTRAEANFIQNLVHYVGPAYRTPDYGIWERGDKQNTGEVEINASSVGMVKAALEAVRDYTFALEDGTEATIRVAPDDIARARETLAALLPLESASKETDASLLAIVGYPAYAIEDAVLAARTREKVLSKLQGEYGCKRFLRDGHQTVIEDASRLHYTTGELKQFENIESEWPLFLTYVSVDAGLNGRLEERDRYLARLDRLSVVRDGVALLPELYVVPADRVAAEINMPGSQIREPNDNLPLFWAQSLWVVAHAVGEGLVQADDIDLLNRRARLGARLGAEVGIAFFPSDATAGAALSERGLLGVSAAHTDRVRLLPPVELARALTGLGAEPSLGLTGRPLRRLSALITSRMYAQHGTRVLFAPSSLDAGSSYMRFDAATLAHRIRTDILYVARHWIDPDPPVIAVPLSAAMLEGQGGEALGHLLSEVAAGHLGAVRVHACDADTLAQEPAQPLDGLPELPTQTAAHTPAEATYDAAGAAHDWRRVRAEAEALGRSDERLPDALKEITVRLRRVSLLPSWADQTCIERPVSADALRRAIRAHAPEWPHAVVLAEETLQHLGVLIRTEPELFLGIRTLRLWDFVNLLTKRDDFGPAETDAILAMPPAAVAALVRVQIESTPGVRKVLSMPDLNHAPSQEWRAWRTRLGVLTRVGESFSLRLWRALHSCEGLIIGPRDRAGQRLDAKVAISDFTPQERKFANLIDDKLSAIPVPSYRTLTLEAMNVFAAAVERDPGLRFPGDLWLDRVIHQAVLSEEHPDPWAHFGALSPFEVHARMEAALQGVLSEQRGLPVW